MSPQRELRCHGTIHAEAMKVWLAVDSRYGLVLWMKLLVFAFGYLLSRPEITLLADMTLLLNNVTRTTPTDIWRLQGDDKLRLPGDSLASKASSHASSTQRTMGECQKISRSKRRKLTFVFVFAFGGHFFFCLRWSIFSALWLNHWQSTQKAQTTSLTSSWGINEDASDGIANSGTIGNKVTWSLAYTWSLREVAKAMIGFTRLLMGLRVF